MHSTTRTGTARTEGFVAGVGTALAALALATVGVQAVEAHNGQRGSQVAAAVVVSHFGRGTAHCDAEQLTQYRVGAAQCFNVVGTRITVTVHSGAVTTHES